MRKRPGLIDQTVGHRLRRYQDQTNSWLVSYPYDLQLFGNVSFLANIHLFFPFFRDGYIFMLGLLPLASISSFVHYLQLLTSKL